jgi:hypothetical protein
MDRFIDGLGAPETCKRMALQPCKSKGNIRIRR